MSSPFVVGIDLGTTNSCLAWTAGGSDLSILLIAQLVSGGRAERALLPSVLYAPVAEEGIAEPFCDPPWVTGELARLRSEEVVGRTVASAKSWLSHPENDPDAPTLPVGASAGSPRLSPIDASARILAHLARAFEAKTRRRLADASVVLTLPASFDESARAATLEAARRAGLRVALLEEPQAAFYDFMARDGALESLLGKRTEALVLVVDVGGGTTDLSLISVERRRGPAGAEIACTRVATGDHLLLGGDNMDLALSARIRAQHPDLDLDEHQAGQLLLSCRVAKEALLAEGGPDSFPISLASRGARLVGATMRTELGRLEARRVLLDGFFPSIDDGPLPPRRRAALVSTGLPYARDAAITRHVARFLERYGGGRAPTAVLLNGGVFRARALRLALVSAIRARVGGRVKLLDEADPDLAVALGAARYGIARATENRAARIAAGAARSYYVGVTTGAGEERAVCVVPRGTPEGLRCEVRAPVLKLRTGEPARFHLYRARTGVVHAVGQVVEASDKSLAELRPLVARAVGALGSVEVLLSGELTPVGTLDLSLREADGTRSFALAFQVRDARPGIRSGSPPPSTRPLDAPPPREASPRAKRAAAIVAAAFSFPHKDGRAAQGLMRELEQVLGDRLGWSLFDARGLADALLERRGARRWSAEHERVFWLLAGLCLRPGFGAAGDDRRLADLLGEPGAAKSRLAFGDRPPVAQAFYVACRRIAPGLDAAAQRAMFDALVPHLDHLDPSDARSPRARATPGESELRELLTWFERLDPPRKVALAERILAGASARPPANVLSELARIGARVPVYSETSALVPPEVVESWLLRLPPVDLEKPAAVASVIRVARVTGVASRDLSVKVRRSFAKALARAGAPPDVTRPLKECVPLSRDERSFGEALPPGLSLEGEA